MGFPEAGQIIDNRDADTTNVESAGNPALRIGVNLLWLVPGEVGGSEEYAVGLVRALGHSQGVELVVFCQPALPTAHPDLTDMATLVPSPGNEQNRAVRLVWENSWLPYRARKHDLDVVHHLGGTVPLIEGIQPILTVYDLQPLTHPERFTPLKRAWLRAVLPQSVRRAGAVLTLSRYVRDQVVDQLPVPPERVFVTPPGLTSTPELLRGSAPHPADDSVRTRYRLDGTLLLYPAISYPHKNHAVLIRSLPRLLDERPDTTLVLTGRPGPEDDNLRQLANELGVDHAVRRLGRVPRSDLRGLYAAAAALVFPSVHEGFGLPLLEAMAHGCPVVAARASATPEIVGDNGVLLAPDDPTAWAESLARLLGDPSYRAELARAAAEGAGRFSWDQVIPRIISIYRSLTTR